LHTFEYIGKAICSMSRPLWEQISVHTLSFKARPNSDRLIHGLGNTRVKLMRKKDRKGNTDSEIQLKCVGFAKENF
jgi:hypothetical protein